MSSGGKAKKRPVVLLILSGFGCSPPQEGNAIAQAHTPFLDQYLEQYPHTCLVASGERVGLPPGQAGNSEVSHMILGAGRVVPLDITRIDDAIAEGRFYRNPTLVTAIDAGRASALHLMGLLSDGGVHAMNSHLYALLEMAAQRGIERVFIHVFTDGRDTGQHTSLLFINELQERMRQIGTGTIATIIGRFYAMDREQRWDRVRGAYECLTQGLGERFPDAQTAIETSWHNGLTDEFIKPAVITEADGNPTALIRPGDSVIFFNFRADRARQLTRAFTGLNFTGFQRELLSHLHFATFTQYDRSFTTPIVFAPTNQNNGLADCFARHGITNLRLAESERFAHVTWFFNGGREDALPYESRISVPSPEVASYRLKPEMSSFRLTDKICRSLDENQTDVYIINFANGDLVGHTGDFSATVKAVEAVDTCLGWVVGTTQRMGGIALITADHGHCEMMIDAGTGAPDTAHTSNPVPFILCDQEFRGTLREGGSLEDVAPTLLELLALDKQEAMTGQSLLQYE